MMLTSMFRKFGLRQLPERAFQIKSINSNGAFPTNIAKTPMGLKMTTRTYATNTGSKPKKNEPKIRYLFYVFLLSSVTVYIGGQKVDKKKPKRSFGSEQELDEYEQTTGLKRRSRLITGENNEKYKFYAIPFYKDEAIFDKVKTSLDGSGARIKQIDVNELIKQEMNDESKKYYYLLHDLAQKNKPYPHGLITALIKNEIQFYINTSQGIYDTNFILKNYPTNTNEASKFETDVASLERVIVVKDDINEYLPTQLPDDQVRKITNVVSYFETVGKSTILDSLNQDLNQDLN